MIRVLFAVSAFLSTVVLGFGQGVNRGGAVLDDFNAAMSGAKSLSATMDSQQVRGASSSFSIDLEKPNLARVETPTTLSVADGTTITTFDKSRNVYFRQPQTEAGLWNLFKPRELSIWLPFFDPNLVKGAKEVKSLGTKTRASGTLNILQVQLDREGTRFMKLFLDVRDNLPRQAEFNTTFLNASSDEFLVVKSITVNEPLPPDTFNFKAASDAHEITADEHDAEVWLTDLAKAKEVAGRTNKLILVDFYADW